MTEHTAQTQPNREPSPTSPHGDLGVRPTPPSQRTLAPDLARGMMLLLIALAHVPYFLYTAPTGAVGLHPVEGDVADRIVQALTLIVVDARVHTMFGFLFAYGIGQLYARQSARHTSALEVRRLLRRRHLWMIVFGAVHTGLLWHGDIIGVYGLIGLLMVPLFFTRTDRTLKIWVGVLLSLAAAFALLSAVGSMVAEAQPGLTPAQWQRSSIAEPDYPVSALLRLLLWISTMLGGITTMALPAAFLMGVLAARHRILDEPGRHLVLLRRLALWGITAGWVTGAALALQYLGVLPATIGPGLSNLHLFAGIFTGVGYAAWFGLIGHRLTTAGRAPGRLVCWIAALGRRSMSGYLVQSLAWGLVLAAWGLGAGAHLSSSSAALLAVVVWATTVAGAAALERRRWRGPAEVLLRDLTYRKTRRRLFIPTPTA